MKRAFLAAAGLAIALAACGGTNPAEDYINGLNEAVTVGFSDAEAASVAHRQIANPTMEEAVAFIEQEIAIRRAFLDSYGALEPPEAITEVHQAVGDAFARLLAAAERLVAVADTAGNLQELEQTPEFAEYQAANADDSLVLVCLDMQDNLPVLDFAACDLQPVFSRATRCRYGASLTAHSDRPRAELATSL